MAIDSDDSISLPRPPPPRPFARQAAIEAALRKYDGIEETTPEQHAPKRPFWTGWTAMDRRSVGAFATAALIAVVSVPLVLTTLRDNAPRIGAPPSSEPAQSQPGESGTRSDESLVAAEPPSSARSPQSPPALGPAPAAGPTLAANEPNAIQEAPEPVAAPPASAPPPPPPAPARSEQYAQEESEQGLVVTGSRVRPNLSKQREARSAADRAVGAASPLAVSDGHDEFLLRLQNALRANDRRTAAALVALPLRVSIDGRTLNYRSTGEIERDFDRVFTSEVRESVLNLRPQNLRSKGSRMMGNDKVSFGPSCPNKACSPAGPIRIREVRP